MTVRLINGDWAIEDATAPTAIYASLRDASRHHKKVHNLTANILYHANGALQHQDVQMMRRAQLTVLLDKEQFDPNWNDVETARITSDGRRVKFEPLTMR